MNEPNLVNKNNKYSLVKPPLYKRLFSGIIDLLFFFILTIGLELGSFYGVFPSLGYKDYINEVQLMYKESHLFNYTDEDGYTSKLDDFDKNFSNLTLLDESITYYYSYDDYAISANRLETYNNIKLKSELFIYEGENLVIDQNKDIDKVYEFLETEYNSAINYFKSNPTFIDYSNKSYSILLYGTLIVIIISSLIYYLLLPLCIKYKVTLGEIIFKIALASSKDEQLAKNKDVVIRNIVFILFNIIAPFLLYTQIPFLALIPIFITILLLSFTKSNLTPHDYMSNTYLVNIEAIKNIKQKVL